VLFKSVDSQPSSNLYIAFHTVFGHKGILLQGDRTDFFGSANLHMSVAV
jgi:hypothetical protein